jgi:hypothetical protein
MDFLEQREKGCDSFSLESARDFLFKSTASLYGVPFHALGAESPGLGSNGIGHGFAY